MQPAPKPEVVKPAIKKPAGVKPSGPVESGPCQIGVIPVGGDLFVVEKFGPFTFIDKYARVSIAAWALDDLVVSRVRAAAAGSSVNRIPYTIEELKSGGRGSSIRFFTAQRPTSETSFASSRPNCGVSATSSSTEITERIGNPASVSHNTLTVGQSISIAIMYIRVYDGTTFALIKEAPALMTEDTYVGALAAQSARRSVERAGSRDVSGEAADAVNNPVLRDGVRTMLTKSLDKTLPALLQRPSPSR